MGIENLAVFSDEKLDPYVTKPEDEDSEEEEDFNLLPTDNLIAVGHVEGDAAILEIYGKLLCKKRENSLLTLSLDISVYYLLAKKLCLLTLNFLPQFITPKKPICTSIMRRSCQLFLFVWNG
jgi:hypothetical protein